MAENKSADEIRGAQALESLLEALAAWPDLGSSAHLSVEQWNSLTAYEVKAHYDERISAVHSVDGGRVVSDHVHALGRLRYAPAVPTLIGLWEACPVRPVAVAAAHALLEIGTVEARDALRKGIHHHDRLGRLMALKVMFSDEGEAWDNVSHLFAGECLAAPAGQIAAAHALLLLAPRGHSRSGPFWYSNELRDLPSRDPRWLDLCISLRDHELLGRSARRALRYADPAVTGPALDAARAARARQVRPAAPRMRAGDLVARYESGDHVGVWRDLAALDHLDGPWRAEAEQVAVMTMERVRRNALSLTRKRLPPARPAGRMAGPRHHP